MQIAQKSVQFALENVPFDRDRTRFKLKMFDSVFAAAAVQRHEGVIYVSQTSHRDIAKQSDAIHNSQRRQTAIQKAHLRSITRLVLRRSAKESGESDYGCFVLF